MKNVRTRLSEPLTVGKPLTAEMLEEDMKTLYEQAGYPVILPPGFDWRAVWEKAKAKWIKEHNAL